MFKSISTVLIIASVLSGCTNTSDRQKQEQTQLFEAIRNQDLNSVQELVAVGNVDLDPPTRPNEVNKALAYASIYGNLEIVEYLLSQGVEIDGRIAYGGTALLRASEIEKNDVAEYLIRAGADVNAPNSFGISAMVGYAINCNSKMIDLALDYGGNINQAHVIQVSSGKCRLAYNPIQWATVKGNLDCVKHLVENGAKTDVLSRDKETLLDLANKQENKDLINYVKKL